MITIQAFDPSYQAAAVAHILDLENNEFKMGLTLEMQPDLADINAMYQQRNGNFWIALQNDTLIGTAGIYALNDEAVELRRMFVKSGFRGKEHDVAQKMLEKALDWSKANGYQQVFLETTDWLVAASRFYLKNGFEFISREELPANLPVLRSSGKFMQLTLSPLGRKSLIK